MQSLGLMLKGYLMFVLKFLLSLEQWEVVFYLATFLSH